MDIPSVSREAVKAESERRSAFRFETLIAQNDRLQSVAVAVLTANAPYCGKRIRALYGLSVLTLENLIPDLHAAASQRLSLDNMVRVVQAVGGSPARRAGLAPGDRILRIGKQEIKPGMEGVVQVRNILYGAAPATILQVAVMRDGRELTLPLRGAPGCDYPAVLAGVGDSAAIERSGGIVLPPDLLTLASSDDELAMALAHQLGHILAGHGKIRGDAAGSVLGGFPVNEAIGATGAAFEPRQFKENNEKAADYLGLYFAARAGFSIATADAFWRKLGAQNSLFSAGHPVSDERFALIGQIRDEIVLKQQSGTALEPNWKPR